MPALVVRDLAAWLVARGGQLVAGQTPPGLDRAVEGVARPRRLIPRDLAAIDIHEAVLVSIEAFPATADFPLDALILALAETQAALIVAGLPQRASAPDPAPYDVADRAALPLLAVPNTCDLTDLAREINDVVRARQVQAARYVRDALTAVSRARHAADPLHAIAAALAHDTRLVFALEDEHRQPILRQLPDPPAIADDQVTTALASYAARQAVRPATPGGQGEDFAIQRHLPGKLARAIVPLRAGTETIAYLSLLGPEDQVTPPDVDLLWRIAPAFAFEMGKLRKQAQDAAPPAPPILPASPPVPSHPPDLNVLRLLEPLRATGALRAFSQSALAALISADTHQGEALLATLDAWFAAHGNLTEAARQLTIHRNTLMYRLNRIQDLLAVPLDDPDTRLALHLALKIWQAER